LSEQVEPVVAEAVAPYHRGLKKSWFFRSEYKCSVYISCTSWPLYVFTSCWIVRC
jgi:hypothetical protein